MRTDWEYTLRDKIKTILEDMEEGKIYRGEAEEEIVTLIKLVALPRQDYYYVPPYGFSAAYIPPGGRVTQ